MEKTVRNKRQLFEAFKEETTKQLTLVKGKDPDRFLESVLICGELIKQIEACSGELFLDQDEQIIKQITTEILEIREQISKLIPDLQNELLNKVKIGQHQAKILKGYREQKIQPPSVFFDRKK
jgi:predicted thioredoxin/glutaredoxin